MTGAEDDNLETPQTQDPHGREGEEPPLPDPEKLKAYRVGVDVDFDLARSEAVVISFGMPGFRLAGRDIFELLDRMPARIAGWFHQRYGTEVVVVPVFATFAPKVKRITDGYVVMTVRSIIAEAERLAGDKPT